MVGAEAEREPITVGEVFTVRAVCVVDQLLEVPGRVGVTAIDLSLIHI